MGSLTMLDLLYKMTHVVQKSKPYFDFSSSLSSVEEHLTVEVSKYQMVTGSNPVVRRFVV
jgi:hypothetical protein